LDTQGLKYLPYLPHKWSCPASNCNTSLEFRRKNWTQNINVW
jgi:hypothetical protein